MTTKEWYKYHEGWIGAFMVAIGAFSFGVLVTVVIEGRAYINQTKSLTDSCTIMLDQKDKIIDRLSLSTITATTNSLKAADQAREAAKTVQKITTEAVSKEKEKNEH